MIKKTKKLSFIALLIIIVLNITNVKADATANGQTYFRTGRTGVLVTSSPDVKLNKPIPAEYSSFGFGINTTNFTFDPNNRVQLSEAEKANWLSINANLKTNLDNSQTTKAVNSIKGKYTKTFKNIGTYSGKTLDVKETVMDFEIDTTSNYHSGATPFILFNNYVPGAYVQKVNWIKLKYEFLDSDTGAKVNVKGYTTYWDVDYYQGIHILDNNTGIYAGANSKLSISDINGKKFIYDNVLPVKDYAGYDERGMIAETFEGTEINRTYTFIGATSDATVVGNVGGGISHSAIVNGALKSYASDTPSGKSGTNVKEGDIIKYEIQYTNGDPNNSAAVTIIDTLSKGLSYNNDANLGNPTVTNNNDESTTLAWSTTLAKASTSKLTYSVTVGDDYENQKVSNDATVTIGGIEYKLNPLENEVTKKGKITVKYLEQGTNRELLDQEEITKYYGESYTTSSKENELTNYNLVSTPSNHEGTVNSDSIEVIYYYKLKEGKIITRYLEEGTNRELLGQEEITKNYTEEYQTSSKENSLPNYNLVRSEGTTSGTVNKDETLVVYYYKLKEGTLTVHHYKKGTTTKLLEDEITTKNYGESYSTTSKENNLPYYDLDSSTNNTSGTINSEETEVIYYYKLKKGQVVEKYLEKTSNKELAQSKTTTYDYGETYETTSSTAVPQNYNLESIEGEEAGEVNKDSIEVIYYYVKKASNINDAITKEGTEEITSSKDLVDYKISYSAKLIDYIGNAKITITDILPYKIDTSKSQLNGGVYNEEKNTITWTENKTNYNSYSDSTITIIKNIKLLFTNIDKESRTMINEVSGTIELDNNESTILNEKITNIKIPGSITVKYTDEEGKEIEESVIKRGLVGEEVSIEKKEIEGYNLVKKPQQEVIKLQEGNEEKIYVYEKIKYNIITTALNEGGKITGDEIVNYGTDSSKKIEIKTDKGYVIKKVLINKEEQKIGNNLKTMTLPVFKNVKENKLIEVEFEKAEVIKIPDTASLINKLGIVLGISLIIASGYFITKKYKDTKK